MNILFLILLCSFMSANVILLQKKYILTKMDGKQYFCVKNILIIIMVALYLLFINREMLHKITNIIHVVVRSNSPLNINFRVPNLSDNLPPMLPANDIPNAFKKIRIPVSPTLYFRTIVE